MTGAGAAYPVCRRRHLRATECVCRGLLFASCFRRLSAPGCFPLFPSYKVNQLFGGLPVSIVKPSEGRPVSSLATVTGRPPWQSTNRNGRKSGHGPCSDAPLKRRSSPNPSLGRADSPAKPSPGLPDSLLKPSLGRPVSSVKGIFPQSPVYVVRLRTCATIPAPNAMPLPSASLSGQTAMMVVSSSS